jgi:hypothetical protein
LISFDKSWWVLMSLDESWRVLMSLDESGWVKLAESGWVRLAESISVSVVYSYCNFHFLHPIFNQDRRRRKKRSCISFKKMVTSAYFLQVVLQNTERGYVTKRWHSIAIELQFPSISHLNASKCVGTSRRVVALISVGLPGVNATKSRRKIWPPNI